MIERIARAVLYEGYLLWPYRRSALKNRHRFTIGGLYPPAYAARSSDRSSARFDALVEGDDPRLTLEARFLRIVDRAPNDDEVVEDVVGLGAFERPPLEGSTRVETTVLRDGLRRVGVEIENASRWDGTSRDEALCSTLLACHAVVRVEGGAFVSTLDPPEWCAAEAAACRSSGLWPVLVGAPGERSTILAAPIVLEEYPQVAPESPGDHFDGGEIDELLVHSIRALTDAEKEEIRAGDPLGRAILERTEALGAEQIARLHGRLT